MKFDFTRNYIIQCVMTAANQLRLSSEKIESLAILREHLTKAENIFEEIERFKKITQLSKLGIKLTEIYNYTENGKIDFLKLSERFKNHSGNLIGDVSNLLDIVTPQQMKDILQKEKKADNENVEIDLTKRKPVRESELPKIKNEIETPKRATTDDLKKEIIFDGLETEEEFNFEKYEARILRPIKEIDAFLNRVARYDYTENEINNYIRTMKENGNLSQKIGFEIISNMHAIFVQGLEAIHNKKVAPSSTAIEALRACLIVIVAVVRGKEVDITNYLNRAENFGKLISQTKRVI
ncbi:hypothetical protein MROS_0018 [Melioribacter roseus P3M-2]|uniref:Uncharacterized protein n=1 Tax=Melioribacter roseus (strain DSM 23840 / JCM 17771 / VKM B-2668 / P3M-2) TaxID=1191523 RepID=I6YRU0_MELRP|nr:hypothetical protein [Melioribacter roseus]AFN73262.1 hypothetical protein MROS_0018 [Melioribacter roseus P3M-2]